MKFMIKKKEFISEVIGIYFTNRIGTPIYKIVNVEDNKYIRFAYLERNRKIIVISGVRFTIVDFYKDLRSGSLIQLNWNDARVPDSLLEYEVKLEKNV